MTRRLLPSLLIVFLLLSLGPASGLARPALAQAGTVYVDTDNTSGTEDGTPAYPYNTIAEGIAAAPAGATVLVAPGTYYENVTVNKDLTLRGSGLDRTTIDGSRTTDTGLNTITIRDGAAVTVEHFKITGGGTTDAAAGLRHYQVGTPAATFAARWNWFTGNGLHGVVSYGADVVEHNLFTNNGDGQGGGYAIWASSGSTAQIYNNTIRRSTNNIGETGSNRAGIGIAIYGGTTPGAPDIRNSIVYDVYTGIAILGTSAPGTTLDYNIVYSNTTNYASVAQGAHDQVVDPKLTTTSYLNTGSPAINAGDPDTSFNDRDGSRNDIGMRQRWLSGATGEGNFATVAARQPMGLAAYAGSAVWMSSYIQDPGIYRLDVANGDPRQALSVPGNAQYQYGGLAYDGATDTLYHSTIYGDSAQGVGGIQALDGGTGAIRDTLPFAVTSGGDLAFDGTDLWQAAGGWMDPRIYRIDASTGAVVDSFVSPVPGQTQTFGLAYANGALWLSKGDRIYKIDLATEAAICSFQAPVDDVRGLAFIPGYDMLASSFSHDQVRRFDLPASCNENTRPSANIVLQWSDGQEHALQYQPAYSNESVCIPRDKWASMYLTDGDDLPRSTGGTIRGLRLQTGNPVDASVVISGTGLSGATLTRCGEGLWAVWSASPAGWTAATGVLPFDWHPRPAPGIAMEWKGTYTQTLRYQYQVVDPKDVSCAPDRTAWSNITLASGDYLPLPIGPKGEGYNGLLLSLAPGDALSDELARGTQLLRCQQDQSLWLIYSDTHSSFVQAYGTVMASWASLPEGQLPVQFQGQGAGEAHLIEWQAIGADESACGKTTDWSKATLRSGEALPLGQGRGVRLKVSPDDLLNITRAEGVYAQKCGGGVTAVYALEPSLWAHVQGGLVIDWAALFENLDCVWFQHTETVAHNRDLRSHLWCQNDGTVTIHYEGGSSDTVEVVDGYASIPSHVDRVTPGGLYAGDLVATLKDRLPITVHIVPVELVDIEVDAPSLEILWLAFDLVNLPFFDVDWEVEPEIDVEGDTANEIWNNMETATNGQPAVVGTDAYILFAGSAAEPVNYELWFGQGPFNTWKGMFFAGHPTTFIHELLHSLLGLKHVGGAPGPDPNWPYGNTRTFPEESTFWGNTQAGTWERLHFTGDDCDALMSYGNSNPYGLGSDYRVRCLSPFTGDKAWDKIETDFAGAVIAEAAAAGPVMWLEGPDLFQFDLTHTTAGNTDTGPALIVNPGTTPVTITVPSYETHNGYITDSFVSVPEGVTSAEFDGRQYPPAFGTLAGTSVLSDTLSRALTVTTQCAWILSVEDPTGERLASGPYVGGRTIQVSPNVVDLQFSCADGERTEALLFPTRIYLPVVLRQ
jgi:hypothetical protein